MIDGFVIAKCIELQNEAARERWRRNEDDFYRDLGIGQAPRIATVWRRFWSSLREVPQRQSGPASPGRSARGLHAKSSCRTAAGKPEPSLF
ncbi:hypothetical protein [Rhizobium sp. RAF56]|jgi:hypothetical protein|uniref:hypothetical protein n=1 Tax=Rhizobium sp. RAF56 TaxID=3233062 RepID=UPI003F95F9D6